MAENKQPTTVDTPTEEVVIERKVTGKVTNPRDIEWPYDPYGFTSMLKKEGVRAVGRIKGDDTKMEILVGVLRTLAQHAEAKLSDQKTVVNAQAKAAEQRATEIKAQNDANVRREIKRLEGLVKDAKASLAAKVEVPSTKAK